MNDLSVAIEVRGPPGVASQHDAIRIGVPLARGQAIDLDSLALIDDQRQPIEWQGTVLARWPDASIKWLLIDAVVEVEGNQTRKLWLEHQRGSQPMSQAKGQRILAVCTTEEISISTGCAVFRFRSGSAPLCATSESSKGVEWTGRIQLTGQDGVARNAELECFSLEQEGSLRTTVIGQGVISCRRGRPLVRCSIRATATAGSGDLELEVTVWNPAAAVHPDGLWDLGDEGSVYIHDLSFDLRASEPVTAVAWREEIGQPARHSHGVSRLTVYQDSSGGPNWDAPNHIDRYGKLTVRFCGYKTWMATDTAGSMRELNTGARADPMIAGIAGSHGVAIDVPEFWQNFPKAIRYADNELSVGLFPRESGQLFELQGGERKRHAIRIALSAKETLGTNCLDRSPLHVSVDPAWIERSGALHWFTAASGEEDAAYLEYIRHIVEGPDSFFEKREAADEYGWRNFGDLHADHEAVHHQGKQPFASHYNNQYDFIYGAFLHFARTGDPRWQVLMEKAARHMMDIDIYRTEEDKAAFNGGLFWHTDHYMSAATCTHRTYSQANGWKGYGGGPSSEHNYTSGLLHYYYLTGDSDAAQSVQLLADWVCAMDDGASNPLALFDEGPTGAATSGTLGSVPGRAAGNSVNALIDAYLLTGNRDYLNTAESFIQRCINPRDKVSTHGFEEPELTWSYLVFLQALGKYLEVKFEFGEIDYMFHYARESLLQYADWMRKYELPYKDLLHKVKIPTETWPAHDIRKCHIFHLAARHLDDELRDQFLERAHWFYGCCLNDLHGFPTRYFTRPMVILAVYGRVHGYFLRHGDPLRYERRHNYVFPDPVPFVPQRTRAAASLKRKLRLVLGEMRRQLRQRIGLTRARRDR